MLGKFKFIFHICAMKETLRGAVKLPFFHTKKLA